MKHIKRDFSLKVWVPGVDLGGGAEAKINLFRYMVMLRIKLKLTTHVATRYQIFCPQTPLDPGVGSKGKTLTFSESSHVAYHIKGNLVQSISN